MELIPTLFFFQIVLSWDIRVILVLKNLNRITLFPNRALGIHWLVLNVGISLTNIVLLYSYRLAYFRYSGFMLFLPFDVLYIRSSGIFGRSCSTISIMPYRQKLLWINCHSSSRVKVLSSKELYIFVVVTVSFQTL